MVPFSFPPVRSITATCPCVFFEHLFLITNMSAQHITFNKAIKRPVASRI